MAKRRILIVVHPRSGRPRLEERDGQLHVWVGPAPVDGAANDAVIAAVADHFDLPRTSVRLVAGGRSRQKILELGS